VTNFAKSIGLAARDDKGLFIDQEENVVISTRAAIRETCIEEMNSKKVYFTHS